MSAIRSRNFGLGAQQLPAWAMCPAGYILDKSDKRLCYPTGYTPPKPIGFGGLGGGLGLDVVGGGSGLLQSIIRGFGLGLGFTAAGVAMVKLLEATVLKHASKTVKRSLEKKFIGEEVP